MGNKDQTRLTRLTAILIQLQSKRLLTAREIADKHQVSIRTVYRDIRALEQSGVPIVTEEGKGYSILQGYSLPPVMFSEQEANALITAEQLIINNKDESFTENYKAAMMKIKSVLRLNQKDKADLLSQRIIFRTNQNHKTTSDYLSIIQLAITNFSLITIDYLSLKSEHTQRIIEPFALYSTNDNWLLIGWCRTRSDFRAFRLDCIQKIIIQKETFSPHNMSIQDYFKICEEKYKSTPDTSLS